VWNCALNAVSALGRAKYGQIASSADAWKVVETAVYEVLAVAKAAGIHPPDLEDPKAALEGALKIATQMAEALSSTGQDLNRGSAQRSIPERLHFASRGGAWRSHAGKPRAFRFGKAGGRAFVSSREP